MDSLFVIGNSNAPDVPEPLRGELPACYADRLGQFYAAHVDATHKKRLGQYLTPLNVARLMARFVTSDRRHLRILDPGAGSGILGCALCEQLMQRADSSLTITLDTYEIDSILAVILGRVLQHLRRYAAQKGHKLTYRVATEDFVLAQGDRLTDKRRLFGQTADAAEYDVVIGNPPYFKIAKNDPRSRAASRVVHGQPNIYALFMAVSASLLRKGGRLVFITPRSFASGPYFRAFREMFFARIRPVLLHIFDSRSDAFGRDEVLQENVVIAGRRDDEWAQRRTNQQMTISSSRGLSDLHCRKDRRVSLASVLDMRSREKVLSIPTDQNAESARSTVHSWAGSLESYGLQISTGPVVAFRAKRFLIRDGSGPHSAPLLWLHNVRPMRIEWPTTVGRKPQHISSSPAAARLLLPARNYVLLRRFTSKEEPRRLVAAPLLGSSLPGPWVGLENHLNYVYRPGGELTEEEAWGLSVLYNSELLDLYFRSANGNTQVSATELRSMPLPPIDLIAEVGSLARAASGGGPGITSVTMRILAEALLPREDARVV